jgi:hypothetical protein
MYIVSYLTVLSIIMHWVYWNQAIYILILVDFVYFCYIFVHRNSQDAPTICYSLAYLFIPLFC